MAARTFQTKEQADAFIASAILPPIPATIKVVRTVAIDGDLFAPIVVLSADPPDLGALTSACLKFADSPDWLLVETVIRHLGKGCHQLTFVAKS
jgi:hypothetical protein